MIEVYCPKKYLQNYLKKSPEEINGLIAKISRDNKEHIIQRFNEPEGPVWEIFSNSKEVVCGTADNMPKKEYIEELTKKTGCIHYLIIFHRQSVTKIELTPKLKKKLEDVDWWHEVGNTLMKEEYIGKFIGVKDKKILVFDTLEQVNIEIENKGLSYFIKYEYPEPVCVG